MINPIRMRRFVARAVDIAGPKPYGSSNKTEDWVVPVTDRFDIVIIGGGVNGAGIARDAAGRGYSVLLCEQGDLAQATSSASTKLIHGGLRYLEHYEFRLVREALAEREVLLRAAPHLIRPLRFILPHDRSLRPAWMIRAGLLLYDHLGRREILPASARLDLQGHAAGGPLRDAVKTGFAYSDCWVDDSRLVVLNALDAKERGADIRPRTRCDGVTHNGTLWRVALVAENGAKTAVEARTLVNATGPWVGSGLNGTAARAIRLVKGSHIVVPRLYDGDHAYILQNTDRRVVFVIPYEGSFSLIGTTDQDYDGDPGAVRSSGDDTAYLVDAVNRWFTKAVAADAVVWSFAGVRPLLDDESPDAATASRDYQLDVERKPGVPPQLTVLGGKITTFRKLAEQAVDTLRPMLGGGTAAWTAAAPLPGGDIPNADFGAFLAEIRRGYSWLPAEIALRMARAYGTRLETLLAGAGDIADLGEHLGGGLHEAEIDYLRATEWAMTAEDILWRRSKLGLHLDAAARARVAKAVG